MAGVLYLFPDTNVFLQCKPLDHVKWHSFGEWNRIQVVVTRPVQAEIDSLKGKGNGRQATKARAASSLLRRLLEEDTELLVLQDFPLVQMTVRMDLKPDESASGSLDYQQRDDQLVGIALAFQKANEGASVFVMTDDTGVMFSAKNVGVRRIDIPEDWTLIPEADEAERRERELREKLVKYERAEPQFKIELQTPQTPESAQGAATREQQKRCESLGKAPEKLAANVSMCVPLSDVEIDDLMSMLVARFPKATDFGSTERQERHPQANAYPLGLFGLGKQVFTPATQREIEDYEDAHDAWVGDFRSRLQSLHNALNEAIEWPLLVASISNDGSRPADDALVVIESTGKLLLMVPKTDDADDEGSDKSVKTGLLKDFPLPPRAPQGNWNSVSEFDISRHLYGPIPGLAEARDFLPSFDHPGLYKKVEFDPNGFYWREGRSPIPKQKLELTCKQWRHSQSSEEFYQHVMSVLSPGEHAGVVRVTVHAANLTAPVVAQLPVRLAVEQVSCMAIARDLVRNL